MKTITIPDRLYQTILATWCGLVVGAVILLGGDRLRGLAGNAEAVDVDSIYAADAEMLQLHAEAYRERNVELLGIIAGLDPEHECLHGSLYDPRETFPE